MSEQMSTAVMFVKLYAKKQNPSNFIVLRVESLFLVGAEIFFEIFS